MAYDASVIQKTPAVAVELEARLGGDLMGPKMTQKSSMDECNIEW